MQNTAHNAIFCENFCALFCIQSQVSKTALKNPVFHLFVFLKFTYHSIFSDYVGFIKKIMKLMQNDYPMIAKIEVELTQEKEMDHLPNRPSKKK